MNKVGYTLIKGQSKDIESQFKDRDSKSNMDLKGTRFMYEFDILSEDGVLLRTLARDTVDVVEGDPSKLRFIFDADLTKDVPIGHHRLRLKSNYSSLHGDFYTMAVIDLEVTHE